MLRLVGGVLPGTPLCSLTIDVPKGPEVRVPKTGVATGSVPPSFRVCRTAVLATGLPVDGLIGIWKVGDAPAFLLED